MAKRDKIWDLHEVIEHGLGTSDLVAFNVMLGLFGAL